MQGSPKDDVLGDLTRRPAAAEAAAPVAPRSGRDGAFERFLVVLPTGESARLRDCSPCCHVSHLMRVAELHFLASVRLVAYRTYDIHTFGMPPDGRRREVETC